MNANENRSFMRHVMDFPATVSTQDASGELRQEKTTLRDVSGGGLRLRTRHKAWYASGQNIEISIDFPESCPARARLTGHGRVVRIDDAGPGPDGEADIGVLLVTPLRFIRTG